MASTKTNFLLHGVSGKIGGIVVKQYRNKTVVCKLPDMSNVKPTACQKANNALFAEAAAYAKAIVADPKKNAVYAGKKRDGLSVYQYALKEFYRLRKEGEV